MPLSLFGYTPKSRAEDCIGSESDCAHTFGGHPRDFDLAFTNRMMPLHLIYRLDLRDPFVPFTFPVIDFLPLLYCFSDGGDCCYQVDSNTEIRLVYPGEQDHYVQLWLDGMPGRLS